MSEGNPKIGAIEWRDLTVDAASGVKDFYQKVVGWETSSVPMGNGTYEDYCMNLPRNGSDELGETVAGVCHARGFNEGLPARWLMYVRVASLSESIENCESSGGKIIFGPKEMGKDEFCVIQDPAGAVLALIARLQVGLKWEESPYLFKDSGDRKLPSIAFLKSISTTTPALY